MFGSNFGELFNRLSDLDWGWWPFLGLRPSKDTPMSTAYVFRLSAAFGAFYAPTLFLLLALAGAPLALTSIAGAVAASVLGFFGVYRFTFAIAWNQRARWLHARRRH
jgi:hypothetical protein